MATWTIDQTLERLEEGLQKLKIPGPLPNEARAKLEAGVWYIPIPFDTGIDGQRVRGDILIGWSILEKQYRLEKLTVNLEDTEWTKLQRNVFCLGCGYDVNLREAFNL